MRILVFLVLALIASPAYSQITIGRYRVNGTIEFNADLQIEEVVPMTTIPDPIAFWKLSDLSSEYGNFNLTGFNSPTFSGGKIGNAMFVAKASSQYARIANASAGQLKAGSASFTNGFTIAGWVYIDSFYANFSFGGNCFIASNDAWYGANRGWILGNGTTGFGGGDKLNFMGAGQVTLTSTTALVEDAWNFVAFRWNAGTGELFVNSATAEGSGAISWSAETTSDFNLGTASNNAAGGFVLHDGALDAFGVWDTALSDAQITALYNDGDGLELAPAPAFSGPLRVKSSAVYQNGSKNSATYQNGSIGGASVN